MNRHVAVSWLWRTTKCNYDCDQNTIREYDMKGVFQALGGAALLALLVGCAAHQPGPFSSLDSATPSCTGLLREYGSIEGLRSQVQHDTEQMRPDPTTPLYFWPRVAGAFMGASEAIATANHRLQQLRTAMANQQCRPPQEI
jgi:hypothetical protein